MTKRTTKATDIAKRKTSRVKTDIAKRKAAKAKRKATAKPARNTGDSFVSLMTRKISRFKSFDDLLSDAKVKATDHAKTETQVKGVVPNFALYCAINLGVGCIDAKGEKLAELKRRMENLKDAMGWDDNMRNKQRTEVNAFITKWLMRNRKADYNKLLKRLQADNSKKAVAQVKKITTTWTQHDSNAGAKKKGAVAKANKSNRVNKKDWCERPNKVVANKTAAEAMAFYGLMERAKNHKTALAVYTKAHKTLKELADEYAKAAKVQIDWAKLESAATK